LQDYWRQIGFLQGNPKKSLMNDLVFDAVQALAFVAIFLMGVHSVFAVVSAWGLGAAVAAAYGLRQFSIRPSFRGSAEFLRSRWHITRWLASDRVAGWGATQLYLILAAALLGPAALGGLKAAQGLVLGPTMVVINGGGSFGLPEATRQLVEGGWTGMAKVSRFVTGTGAAAAAAFAIVVFLAAPRLLAVLYGPEFVKYAPCARIFAASVVIAAFSVGPILKLTATRRVRPLFFVQLGKLAFSVAAVCVLSTSYGVTGAAASDLLTATAALSVLLFLQSRVHRSFQETQPKPGMQLEAEGDEVKRALEALVDELKNLMEAVEESLSGGSTPFVCLSRHHNDRCDCGKLDPPEGLGHLLGEYRQDPS
jgi:O-antigen/teichoic acid export membrane protein